MNRKVARKLFETPRTPIVQREASTLQKDIAFAKKCAELRATLKKEECREAHSQTEPSEFVAQQLQVQKWKTTNADETNDMEALPPISLTLNKKPGSLEGSYEEVWLALSYGPFAVRIYRNPFRLTGPHEIFLYERNNNWINPVPIAQSFTEEFVYTKRERALEQYIRVLCEDIF